MRNPRPWLFTDAGLIRVPPQEWPEDAIEYVQIVADDFFGSSSDDNDEIPF